jgi:hypothetical protein
MSRLGELGLRVEHGKILFRPSLLHPEEILREKRTFTYADHAGEWKSMDLEAGQMVFTFCQYPVVCSLGTDAVARVHLKGGDTSEYPGNELPAEISQKIFARDPGIEKLEFTIPPG